MSVTLSAGSVVAQPGQQINVASLANVTAGNDPTYLVVSLLDRDEYTAKSNGETGTLSGNGQTLGLDYLWGDNRTAGIVFTYDASTGQYTNATYGDLSNLVYTASTNSGDDTDISIFTTEDPDIANQYVNDPLTLVSYAPTSTNYVGSVAVTTQPHFAQPTPEQATPSSICAVARSFVGQVCNMTGCWVLASNISAEAGASLPITSTMLGVPGVASGEWIVAYNGPAGQKGNWQAQITAGEIVMFSTSSGGGHITTVVSGFGSSAMVVDNLAYENQSGQITNSANDGAGISSLLRRMPPATSGDWRCPDPSSFMNSIAQSSELSLQPAASRRAEVSYLRRCLSPAILWRASRSRNISSTTAAPAARPMTVFSSTVRTSSPIRPPMR